MSATGKSCIGLLLLLVIQEPIWAQSGIEPYIEYRKRVETAQNISPLDDGLFGDQVSLYNGATEFNITDIDVRGNNSLPVQVGRRLSIELQPQNTIEPYDTRLLGIGNWDSAVPYLAAVYPSTSGWPTTRCSGGSVPANLVSRFYRAEFWQGITAYIPGRGSTNIMGMLTATPRPPTGTYRFTTSERDVLDCIPMKSGLAGEGFRMTTSSGVRYFFDVAVTRTASKLMKYVKPARDEFPIEVYMGRTKYYLLASKVEDRFGNTVEYQYNASAQPTRIWANDGREIVLSYTSGRLSNATSHGRTWQYQYHVNGDLAQVVYPDGSRWGYSYSGSLTPPPDVAELPSMPWCSQTPLVLSAEYSVTINSPSGATGMFAFANQRHFRSGVHATECAKGGDHLDPDYTLLVPHYFDVMSIASKTFSGSGLATPLTWTYGYTSPVAFLWGLPTQAPAYPCTTCEIAKSTLVTNPDGTKVRHSFGMRYYDNDGRLLKVEALDAANAVLRTETRTYMNEISAASQPFYGEYGSILGSMNDPASARIRPIINRSILQQGVNFIWQANAFDSSARPINVTQSSAPTP